MDPEQLKRGYRNAWILVFLAAVFVVLFFLFVVEANQGHPAVEWDMGGVEFVPASSIYANGYYTGLERPAEDTYSEER